MTACSRHDAARKQACFVALPERHQWSSLFDAAWTGSLQFGKDDTLVAWAPLRPTMCRWHPDKAIEQRVVGSQYQYGRLAADGKQAVVWSRGGPSTLHLMNVETRQERELHKGHSRPVRTIAVLPDSKVIVSASLDNTIRLWDAADGHELRRWRPHGDRLQSVALAADGRTLASSGWEGEGAKGSVRHWDMATGRELRSFNTVACERLAFSSDGRLLFGAGERRLQLWDPARGKLLREMEATLEATAPPDRFDETAPPIYFCLENLAPAPDGRSVLAVFTKAGICHPYRWKTATGRLLPLWPAMKELDQPLVYSQSGSILIAAQRRVKGSENA